MTNTKKLTLPELRKLRTELSQYVGWLEDSCALCEKRELPVLVVSLRAAISEIETALSEVEALIRDLRGEG